MSFPAALAGGLFLGVFTWSFLEYCVHRWAGHDRRLRGNIFEREHTRHHSQGDYFAPTSKKLAAAFAALALTAPLWWVFGAAGVAYSVGFAGFYLYYEALHRREHTHQGIGPYGRWARRHHFYHHFCNPKANHGVTSPLWDFVFGTYEKPEVIPVPRKLAMRWLLDPTGQIRAAHTSAYRLR